MHLYFVSKKLNSISVKMKLVFFLFFLLNFCHSEGKQQQTERFLPISLKFSFPPFYNSYTKYCCKLYPGGCYRLLDSAGYTCDSLRGRVRKTEMYGLVQFEISNVQLVDAGFYRCRVQGTPVYSDYYIELFEVSDYSEQTQFTMTTTTKAPTKAPTSSTELPDSTGPVMAQDRSDSSRASRGVSLPLIAVVSITVMVFVTAVIGAVYCRVKAQSKQSDTCEGTRCESLKQDTLEANGIIYTTVDFTAHRKPEEVYANLQVNKTQAGGPEAEHDGTVEYSVLAN